MKTYYPEDVGFDYAQAVRELNRRFSYEQIADALGYASRVSVINIVNGAIPAHDKGEALYIFYVETFDRKPPARLPAPQKVQSTEQTATT